LLAGHDHLNDHYIERTGQHGTHRLDHIVTGGGGPIYRYTGEADLQRYADTALPRRSPSSMRCDRALMSGNPHHFVDSGRRAAPATPRRNDRRRAVPAPTARIAYRSMMSRRGSQTPRFSPRTGQRPTRTGAANTHVREPPQRTLSTRRVSDSTGVAKRRAASCRIAGRTTRAIMGVVRPPIGHDAGSRPARQAGPSNPSLSGLGGLGGQT
jgi:hypothetical protein